jgi:nitrogen-specific signal transduction histidine kinase
MVVLTQRSHAIRNQLLLLFVGLTVLITIADNGLGMPQQIQEQIFNPFFTIKPVGKRTGMGYHLCQVTRVRWLYRKSWNYYENLAS